LLQFRSNPHRARWAAVALKRSNGAAPRPDIGETILPGDHVNIPVDKRWTLA
jgi:hypothetical protein